jgi:hypothetical protein
LSRADWIDLREPGRSLFLAAPLATESGGLQKCKQAIYEGVDDPDYRTVFQLVESAVAKAWENPRRDLMALVNPSVADSP